MGVEVHGGGRRGVRPGATSAPRLSDYTRRAAALVVMIHLHQHSGGSAAPAARYYTRKGPLSEALWTAAGGWVGPAKVGPRQQRHSSGAPAAKEALPFSCQLFSARSRQSYLGRTIAFLPARGFRAVSFRLVSPKSGQRGGRRTSIWRSRPRGSAHLPPHPRLRLGPRPDSTHSGLNAGRAALRDCLTRPLLHVG